MKSLIKRWLKSAEKCRKFADTEQNKMTQQAQLAEAYSLEVCADELKRKLKENEE